MRKHFTTLVLSAGLLLGTSLLPTITMAQGTFQAAPMEGMRQGNVPPSNIPPVAVPACQFAGEEVTADLSTTTPSHWSVQGPAQSTGTPPVGGPTHATLTAWTALASDWIQPFATSYTVTNPYGNAWPSAAPGTYTYTIHFTLPCRPNNYQRISLSGTIAADNSYIATMNGGTTPIASCSGSNCFHAPLPITASNIMLQPLNQGDNYITVTVKNDGGYTGMAAQIKLVLVCGKECCITLPTRRK